MTLARSALDFALRLAFFAAAPVAIVKAASLFPVGAAVVQIAIAIGVFCAGEVARGLAERSGLARRLLRKQLELEAFFRENPPRPFLYYVLLSAAACRTRSGTRAPGASSFCFADSPC